MCSWYKERQPTELTRGQLRLARIIQEVGMDVELEHPVGPYRIDCYLPEPHVGIEFDGPTHRGPRARERDELRDREIYALSGIVIMRVRDDEMSDRGALEERIRRFVSELAPTAEQRRRSWPTAFKR